MTHRLKRCMKCFRYTITTKTCPVCKSPVENVHPPRFSLQDKYQEYRLPYFKEKMQSLIKNPNP